MQQLARIRESSQDKPFDLLIIGGAPAVLTGPTCYCGSHAQGNICMGCKTAQGNICTPLRLRRWSDGSWVCCRCCHQVCLEQQARHW